MIEFDSYVESETKEKFSKIKDKITGVFSHEKEKEDRQQHNHHQHQLGDVEIKKCKEQSNKENHNHWNGKLVPFYLDSNNDDVSSTKEENIIPIWGEEVIINKRMIKLGEIVIRKHEINITQKIDVDVKTEKLTVKYPDNRREEIF